jgi:hypothetical protein
VGEPSFPPARPSVGAALWLVAGIAILVAPSVVLMLAGLWGWAFLLLVAAVALAIPMVKAWRNGFWPNVAGPRPVASTAPEPAPGRRRELAVPLLPAEASTVIEILHMAERLPNLGRPSYAQTDSGTGYAMHLAETVLANAGIASELGQPTVPLIKLHVDQVGDAVRVLELLLADKGYAGRCRLLHAKLVAHYGVAMVNGWTVDHDPVERHPHNRSHTYRWSAGVVPVAHDTAMPRLVAGLRSEDSDGC